MTTAPGMKSIATVRRRRRLLAALALLYAAGLLTWQALRHSPAARWGPFELADIFGLLWLYLPLPLLAMAVLVRRDGRAALCLAVPLLTLGFEYGPSFVPEPPVETARSVRVMTANLRAHNAEAEAVAAAILESASGGPDLIAFQELGADIAAPLGGRLAATHPYQAFHPNEEIFGMGVASRYPIVESLPPRMGPDTCDCQQITIDIDGRLLSLINVHFGLPEIEYTRLWRLPLPVGFESQHQEQNVRQVLALVESIPGPLLLVGDFNVSDRQPFYRELSHRLGDAHRSAGWGLGYTFPSSFHKLRNLPLVPFIRIDYVFYDQAFASRAARSVRLPGSDHLSVLAELALR
jgi:endonuclease/exonuclease/phosphatase (EEP) superfamily protein YafD